MSTAILKWFCAPRRALSSLLAVATGLALVPCWTIAQQGNVDRQSIVHKIDSATERMELIVNSSRILTLGQNIPRAQVNNPEVLELTALSPNQIQVFAKKPGVTQVNLWDENDNVYTVDVSVYGDARELQMLLEQQFPNASLRIVPVGNSVVLSGFVPEAEQVSRIHSMAQQYYTSVINNMQVGGVQQVLLHVKVMEVSRTKLRQLGMDWSIVGGSGFAASGVSGLLDMATAGTLAPLASGDTFRFGIIDNTSFFGFLDALRKNDMLKILAEPNLITVSGRPANFLVGGEFPILVPQSLGTVSIEFRSFGTEIDFVPIVLGNGNIRLEVRGRISEIDNTRSVTQGDITVPGLRVREVNTGLEMQAGQTLALAGLVQSRTEAQNLGLPYLADLPFFGVPFRKVREETNEIELLIMVRPELVAPLDPDEVPPGGPGLKTTSPCDCDLYFKGHLEVPICYGPHGPLGGPHGLPPEEVQPGPEQSSPEESTPSAWNSFRPGAQRRGLLGGRRNWPSQVQSAYISDQPDISEVRPPSYMTPSRNNPSSLGREPTVTEAPSTSGPPGLIGPIGYDVLN